MTPRAGAQAVPHALPQRPWPLYDETQAPYAVAPDGCLAAGRRAEGGNTRTCWARSDQVRPTKEGLQP